MIGNKTLKLRKAIYNNQEQSYGMNEEVCVWEGKYMLRSITDDDDDDVNNTF
jgi:hypothetical protein